MTALLVLPTADIQARYAAGATAAEIGRVFGCSKRPILRILKQHGTRIRKAAPRSPTDWDRRKAEIVDRYLRGETQAQIATIIGCTQTVVGNHLRTWRVETRRTGPQRQLPLDEDFFATIDNELKAYWLGFLLADGGTNDSNNLIHRLELGIKDADHVLKFMEALGRPGRPNFDYDKGSARVDICCARLCRDLAALECKPRKTCNHGTPQIPERLERHFYRGYVDGDGGLRNHGRSWVFDATGAPIFIQDFQQWLCKRAGVGQTKLYGRRTWTVRYTGHQQILRIAALLYEDATVYLDRKFQAYQRLKTWLPPGQRKRTAA